ncbi:MAG: hypothetical protein LBO74_05895 [Candidatus Symbiothrix sp.]|jgi:hypothetical protein|nr:hypothetical protein [Candidatus Symbiothrix sp.]
MNHNIYHNIGDVAFGLWGCLKSGYRVINRSAVDGAGGNYYVLKIW